MTEPTMPVCDACKNGDHGFHSGGRLAFICIGCSCEWMPGDPEPTDPTNGAS